MSNVAVRSTAVTSLDTPARTSKLNNRQDAWRRSTARRHASARRGKGRKALGFALKLFGTTYDEQRQKELERGIEERTIINYVVRTAAHRPDGEEATIYTPAHVIGNGPLYASYKASYNIAAQYYAKNHEMLALHGFTPDDLSSETVIDKVTEYDLQVAMLRVAEQLIMMDKVILPRKNYDGAEDYQNMLPTIFELYNKAREVMDYAVGKGQDRDGKLKEPHLQKVSELRDYFKKIHTDVSLKLPPAFAKLEAQSGSDPQTSYKAMLQLEAQTIFFDTIWCLAAEELRRFDDELDKQAKVDEQLLAYPVEL